MKLLHPLSHIQTKIIVILIAFSTLISGASASVTAQTDLPLDSKASFFADGNHLLPEIGLPVGFEPIPPHQLETFSLKMPQLDGREKSIIMYLPSEYSTGISSYPVIYVNETKETFIDYDPFQKSWHLNQSLFDFYTKDFDSKVIIVALQNKSNKFWDEYSPWVKEDMYYWVDPYEGNRVEGGEGDAYLDFIIHTLKPEIDSRYRTLPGHEYTGIAGTRMGGLISLYAGITRPETFSHVMSMSPSIWFAEDGGVWLSNNRLLSLIEKISLPDNVLFKIDISSEDRTTDIDFYPVIYDSHSDKLSYSQAYLEGVQQLIITLVNEAFPITNISGGTQNPEEWTEPLTETSDRTTRGAFIFYLPLIYSPPIPPQITSDPAATFVIGHNHQFEIITTGNPTPEITYTGQLPASVSFSDLGDGTALLSYTSTEQDLVGVYSIIIKADNGTSPSASQYFELRIAKPDGLACPTNGSCILNFDISMTPFLNRTRRIWVYLPPNYNNSGLEYQVLYLTDSQHLFGAEAGVPLGSLRDWKFDKTLDELYVQHNKGTIAVAVEYDADYPWDEYSPWNNQYMNYWVGDSSQNFIGVGDDFLHFIVYELKPTIDSSYRTLPGREHTGIGGVAVTDYLPCMQP